MDEKVCVFLVFGALFCAIVAFINESVTPLLFAVECPCCLTVFRVRTLMTDGAGRLMRDEYETIPMFCPMCGGRLEQSERKE